MTWNWDALVGAERELAPIWDAYHLASVPAEQE